jgi:hypothetical protein
MTLTPGATALPACCDRPAPGQARAGAAGLRWQSLSPLSDAGGASLREAIAAGRPAVLDEFAADWPAFRRWTPEQLTERFGQRSVRVYDASFGAPGRHYMGSIATMSFAAFLEETQTRGRDLRMFLYNLSRQLPELLDDVCLPEVGLRFSRRFVFSFFGCRGSTTPLHYDIDMAHVLHGVIRGRRRVRLFPPEASTALYRHPCTVRSYVDLDTPDLTRFPALAHAAGFEVVLEPGQALYMPPGWWHEFHYLEAGMGVSLRAAPASLGLRARSAGSLLVTSPLDRLANRLSADSWYRWKCRSAERRAEALIAARAAKEGTQA